MVVPTKLAIAARAGCGLAPVAGCVTGAPNMGGTNRLVGGLPPAVRRGMGVTLDTVRSHNEGRIAPSVP
ncbi:hypothetical protein GCM10009605_60480 [Nocardiopsis composta]